jgi:hypothetical protein
MFKYNLTLVKGLFFEITDIWEDKQYKVLIFEEKDGEKTEVYRVMMGKNTWCKLKKRYLCNYLIEIWDGQELKTTIDVIEQLKGKRVFITFESKSLGDTIARIPYCLEFKKKFQCDVIVSSFINEISKF